MSAPHIPQQPSADQPRSRSGRRPQSLVARSPEDLVAIVPLVLGFHPRDSVVLVTFGGRRSGFHARVDLPLRPEDQAEVARVLCHAARVNEVDRTAVLVYTDDVRVAEAQSAVLVEQLLEAGMEIIDVLRVDDGCWHAVPEDDGPGTPYDLSSHRFTAEHVFGGGVVEPDRASVADSLVGTDEEDANEVALAATRYVDLVATATCGGEGPDRGADFWRTEARWLQQCLREHLAAGSRPRPAEAGRMLVLASVVKTRDVAWAEIDRECAHEHVRLWRDLVRRCPRDLLPGPAALLAFAAWQQGNGALAWCAIDRCLDVDPDYSMAHCVAETLVRAVPPSAWVPLAEEELPVFAPSPPQSV